MDTYRTPARFPGFESVLYQEHTFTDKRQNTRNRRQNRFLRGTWPDYLVKSVCWQKMRGHIWKKLYKNREIVVARTVGVWEHTDSWLGAQIGSVLKPIQTLKEYFWSHVHCAHLGTPCYQIFGSSRTVSNREYRIPSFPPLMRGRAFVVAAGTDTLSVEQAYVYMCIRISIYICVCMCICP